MLFKKTHLDVRNPPPHLSARVLSAALWSYCFIIEGFLRGRCEKVNLCRHCEGADRTVWILVSHILMFWQEGLIGCDGLALSYILMSAALVLKDENSRMSYAWS